MSRNKKRAVIEESQLEPPVYDREVSGDRAEHEGFHQIVKYHGAAMVPRLREFSFEKRMVMMMEASRINMENPVYLPPFDKKQFVVRSWDDYHPITGGQLTALLVFGMWVHIGEREELADALLKDWPEILDAKKLGYLDQ